MSLFDTSRQVADGVAQHAQRFQAEAGQVFMVLFAVLLVASVIGRTLKYRLYGQPSATIDNLNARIDAWWLMSLVLLLAFLFGRVGTIVLFFLVSFVALREFLALVYSRRSDYGVLVACFYLLLPLQYWFVLSDWYGMFSIFIPVYGFLLLPILVFALYCIHVSTTDSLAKMAQPSLLRPMHSGRMPWGSRKASRP